MLHLGVGTGIGSGLAARSAVPGLGRGSFEIGHAIVETGGVRCVRGRRKCLQAVAARPAPCAAPLCCEERRSPSRNCGRRRTTDTCAP
ncbi:hypothetical protein ACWD5R_40530 [Streptomyces sp. NPDC002514]|uniref:hypothetical protein n=1 Tax=Streptomyces sp. NPDC001270 TaxID=3364554 RepID=UPI0036C292C9